MSLTTDSLLLSRYRRNISCIVCGHPRGTQHFRRSQSPTHLITSPRFVSPTTVLPPSFTVSPSSPSPYNLPTIYQSPPQAPHTAASTPPGASSSHPLLTPSGR